MTLPYDYARCENTTCPLACRRKEPGHPTYQPYSDFPGGDGCEGLIRYATPTPGGEGE